MARADALGLFWADEPKKARIKMEKVKCTPPEPTWLRPDYLPGLQEAIEMKIPLMTDWDLLEAARNRETLLFDIECYRNYFLAGFLSVESQRTFYLEMTPEKPLDIAKLKWVLENFRTVGFNSLNYDLPITTLALAGRNCEVLKRASDTIIVEKVKPSDVLKMHRCKKLRIDHIDIIEVAPLSASLKIYGGRAQTPHMQDLPFPPDRTLSPEQIAITRWYCLRKDLVSTNLLLGKLKEPTQLRETLSYEYGTDLRSKSDAQIAEAVIGSELQKLTGRRPQKPYIEIGSVFSYAAPNYLQFRTPTMQWVLNEILRTPFIVDESGAIGLPDNIKSLKIPIGNSNYQMGIGGLHSTEEKVAHVADSFCKLEDFDVTSFYPFLILNQGLYPAHLGPEFLVVLRSIVDRRIAAKRNGQKSTAETLKIVINGAYGKLGSKYSIFYAPELLIRTTLTGQLSLLMLIESLELAGIPVVSANTDGIVVKCPHHLDETKKAILKEWELRCNLQLEGTDYLALFSRDVNNYIALKKPTEKKPKIEFKTKGEYAEPDLKKNPTNFITVEAIMKLLGEGVPIEQTITTCKDVFKFATVRAVSGGGVKTWGQPLPYHKEKKDLLLLSGFEQTEGGFWMHKSWPVDTVASTEVAYEHAKTMWPAGKYEFLGKAIRWYYGKGETGEIVYANSGKKVPKSDGAKPLMDIPDNFPEDLDYDWYIKEAYSQLEDIGYLHLFNEKLAS